ncbi:Alanyl-tRNA editing protein Aarsd1 [Phlyctochytrium planicorne]|nr:Alanyl-tRNA editing protein Aarsd1 [Phlyctochytrium planicorne]
MPGMAEVGDRTARTNNLVSLSGKFEKAMTVPIPVGRLLCQRQPLLKSTTATIVSIKPSEPAPDASSKASDASPAKPRLDVVLGDTILFPTGGGQPNDLGSIGGVPVVDVVRKGLQCVHVVEDGEALKEGEEVEVLLDWGRRWDHMQQHSGQHLLSAIAERDFGLETVAWGLGKERCHVEFDLGSRGAPTADELNALETSVNALIRDAIPYSVVEEDGHAEGERPDTLPEDLTEGVVRYVLIGSIDRNPCCGTHVTTTADLQCLKLLHTEKVRGKNLRLFFLFGDRVISTFQDSLVRERTIGALLSTGPDFFVEKITMANKQIKDSSRQAKNLLKELATHLSRHLSSVPTSKPLQPVYYHRDDISDPEFLSALSKTLLDGFDPANPRIYILTCGEVKTGGNVVMVGPALPKKGGSEEAVRVGKAVEDIWKKFLEGTEGEVKGGGGGGRFQGKCSSWKNRVKAVEGVGALVVEN